MRTRLALSSMAPKILHKIFLKTECASIIRKLMIEHGTIIPFRVLPKNEIQRQELFILLRERKYIPNHELKLFVQ